jgi:hypothetical protein
MVDNDNYNDNENVETTSLASGLCAVEATGFAPQASLEWLYRL